MIKLTRKPKPSFLTAEKVIELTEEFKEKGTNVWNNDLIKIPLLESSFKKCAYCECNISEESKYMEVEHFEDKSNNPDRVIEWENLLPSCKRCNGSKSAHDVLSTPIVNPYIDNPNEHFYLRPYRLKSKTKKGQNSIEVNDLNNSLKVVRIRFDIGNKLEETIEDAEERCQLYFENKITRRKNRFVNIIKSILYECQPHSIYSATTATILHTNEIFKELVEKLKNEDLWDSEHDELYNNSIELTLEYA